MQENQVEVWSVSHLNALRGLAALAVAYSHARVLFFPPLAIASGAPGPRYMTIGHEAVMIFFVLSGYLVGGSVLRSIRCQSWSWRDYLIKRLVRLWIVLIPAIAITVLLDTLGIHLFGGSGSVYEVGSRLEFVAPDVLAVEHSGSVILGNVFFLQTVLFPQVGTNIPVWSLAYEFWYYIAFPCALMAADRRSSLSGRLAAAVAVIAVLTLLGRDGALLMLPWLMGAAVSQLPRAIPPRLRAGAAWCAVAGVAVVFLASKKYALELHWAELASGLAASLLIYAVICQDQSAKTGLYAKVSDMLARISYTFYLTHMPFMVFLFAAFGGVWAIRSVSAGSLLQFFGSYLATLAWACIVYWLFESRTDAVREAVMRLLGKRLLPAMPPE